MEVTSRLEGSRTGCGDSSQHTSVRFKAREDSAWDWDDGHGDGKPWKDLRDTEEMKPSGCGHSLGVKGEKEECNLYSLLYSLLRLLVPWAPISR